MRQQPPLPSAPRCIISISLITTSYSDPTILDTQSSQSQILAILVLFGLSRAKIWDDPALPTQAKPQPGPPVTRSNFIPLRSNCYRVLTVKFSPFLGHFGSCSAILSIFGRYWPFLALLGQKWGLGDWGHTHTPNCVEASVKTYSIFFHAIPAVLDQ